MPGISIAGVGDGDARGVGEGIDMECPGCCADAETAFPRTNTINDKTELIVITIHEITRDSRTIKNSCWCG